MRLGRIRFSAKWSKSPRKSPRSFLSSQASLGGSLGAQEEGPAAHLAHQLSSKTAPLAPSTWNCSLPAGRQAGWLAGCSSGWRVQEALSWERAGKRGEAFLTLDSRWRVGVRGRGKAGATSYCPAGHKWPPAACLRPLI